MKRRVVGLIFGVGICILLVSALINSTSDPYLEPIPTAGMPTSNPQIFEIGSLVFNVSGSVYTSATHSGINDIGFRVSIYVQNYGNTTIIGLRFAKMTIYWEDHEAYFTTELNNLSTIPNSILPNNTASIELRNRRPWSDIPVELCWGAGGGVYGRILVMYGADQEAIISTNLIYPVHMVE